MRTKSPSVRIAPLPELRGLSRATTRGRLHEVALQGTKTEWLFGFVKKPEAPVRRAKVIRIR